MTNNLKGQARVVLEHLSYRSQLIFISSRNSHAVQCKVNLRNECLSYASSHSSFNLLALEVHQSTCRGVLFLVIRVHDAIAIAIALNFTARCVNTSTFLGERIHV